jgi:hypothetical protein
VQDRKLLKHLNDTAYINNPVTLTKGLVLRTSFQLLHHPDFSPIERTQEYLFFHFIHL